MPVVLRPVSNISSDLCQLSSPPSVPSESAVRLGPTTVMSGPKSVASSTELPIQQVRGRAGFIPAASVSPMVPLAEPVSYKVEKGARIPVYAEVSAVPVPPGLASFAAGGGESSPQFARGVRVGDPSSPSSVVREGYPPAFISAGVGIRSDPDFPGQDGEGEGGSVL